jgi:hypothetical protein
MVAQRAVRMNENSFRDKYERYTQQDPGNPEVRRKALTAVAARMARVAYFATSPKSPEWCQSAGLPTLNQHIDSQSVFGERQSVILFDKAVEPAVRSFVGDSYRLVFRMINQK